MKKLNRNEKIELIAHKWTDQMDTESLMDFFYSAQIDFLDEKSEDILDSFVESLDD